MGRLVVVSLLLAWLSVAARADDPGRAGFWIWHQSADAARGVPGGAAVCFRLLETNNRQAARERAAQAGPLAPVLALLAGD